MSVIDLCTNVVQRKSIFVIWVSLRSVQNSNKPYKRVARNRDMPQVSVYFDHKIRIVQQFKISKKSKYVIFKLSRYHCSSIFMFTVVPHLSNPLLSEPTIIRTGHLPYAQYMCFTGHPKTTQPYRYIWLHWPEQCTKDWTLQCRTRASYSKLLSPSQNDQRRCSSREHFS